MEEDTVQLVIALIRISKALWQLQVVNNRLALHISFDGWLEVVELQRCNGKV